VNAGRTIFAQLMDCVSPYEFRVCVDRYGGHYKIKSFSCWDQFLCLAFAQLTYRESLRDIQACLRVAQPKLYHMGFRSVVARNTLAHANEVRDWRIVADFAQSLIATARTLYAAEAFGVELEQTVYAFDSTMIDLCLALFPWATFRKRKGAVKLHALLDLRGNIPTVCFVTPGSVHDVNLLDRLLIEAGAFYVFDRAYLDFARLYRLHQTQGFFVTRAKRNFRFRYLDSRPVDRATGVHSDQIIRLYGFYSKQSYPERLRRIRFFDVETRKWLVFLTNNFTLPALTIAQLYKCRWQIELFFKWLKQHLRIKAFYGTSENAVKTQLWVAIAMYVLVAIVKKQLGLEASLYTILQILSVSLFEKIPLGEALALSRATALEADAGNQLNLFE
jgi:IS4 transposase